MTTRCKMKCSEIVKRRGYRSDTKAEGDLLSAKFYVVGATSAENTAFFASTPICTLEIASVNPDAMTFDPGKEYYVDITPAP